MRGFPEEAVSVPREFITGEGSNEGERNLPGVCKCSERRQILSFQACGSFQNGGPQNRPQYTMIRIIRTPKEGPQICGTPHAINSKGSGNPVETTISAPHEDYKQQKLEIVFRSLPGFLSTLNLPYINPKLLERSLTSPLKGHAQQDFCTASSGESWRWLREPPGGQLLGGGLDLGLHG